MNLNAAFKALAYPALNLSPAEPVSPCPCSLVFRCDEASKQATLLLVARIPTTRDSKSLCVLQYDADQLMSHTVRLSSGNSHLQQAQLYEILRDRSDRHRDIKTLGLSLERPCVLWCSSAAPAVGPEPGPEPGDEPSLGRVAALAKATTVHIAFDYKHIRKEHRGMFRAFSRAAGGLVGCPVAASLASTHGLRKASWEVFAPADAAGAPPAYERSRAGKRPRQASPSPPAQPSKRFAPRSPADSHSSGQTIPFSPETAAAALARALRKASPALGDRTAANHAAAERQLPAHLDRLQTEAIEAAVAKQLTAHRTKDLHTEIITAAVDAQLTAHLTTILPTLLPSSLEALLAGSPTADSPATSFTSYDSHEHRYPKLPALTPIGTALLPHLRTHLTSQFNLYQSQQVSRFQRALNKTFDRVEDSAYYLRVRTAAEFEEELEEHSADLSLLKGDAIQDLWTETQEVFQRGREQGEELAKLITDQIGVVCERIEGLKRLTLRRLVASEVTRRKKRGSRVGVGRRGHGGGRALLGRKRGEDAEWVDC